MSRPPGRSVRRCWAAVAVAAALAAAGCSRVGYRRPVGSGPDDGATDRSLSYGDGTSGDALAPADRGFAPADRGAVDLPSSVERGLPLADAGPADLPVAVAGWERLDFIGQPSQSPCTGARWVKPDARYGLWVGAILCSAQRYKLMLSTSRTGRYYEAGDCGGHGQDHCELVNPSFTLPVSDDIKSACPACDILGIGSIGGTAGFHRCSFGEPFAFAAQLAAGIHSYAWIECDVAIPY